MFKRLKKSLFIYLFIIRFDTIIVGMVSDIMDFSKLSEKMKEKIFEIILVKELNKKSFKLNKGNHELISEIDSRINLGTVTSIDIDEIEKFDFVSKLNSENLPEMDIILKSPEPIEAKYSILEEPLSELESFNIEDLRSAFMYEIRSLENDENKDIQLQKIFSLLMDFEYDGIIYSDDSHLKHEHRLYADLISTPGLFEIDYVVDFLKNKFYAGGDTKKRDLLLSIFEYYATHSQEACDKFNYIFRSSDQISNYIFRNTVEITDFGPIEKSNYSEILNFYFSEKVMSSFGKEDLSQLFKFYFCKSDKKKVFEQLFSPENSKSLFMISQMVKKINSKIGHSQEFIQNSLTLWEKYNLKSLLEDVYDKVVGNCSNEESFELVYSKYDDLNVMNELINYIDSYVDYFTKFENVKSCNNLKEFMDIIHKYRKKRYEDIFEEGAIEKIKNGTFDPVNDFRKIDKEFTLETFKDAVLIDIYGINLHEANRLKSCYGRYIEELEIYIKEEDIPILDMFKAIINIAELGQPDLIKKLDVVRKEYLNKIQEKGLYNYDVNHSFIIIKNLLNRMYMNSYNNVLTNISDNHQLIKYDDGVPLYDAGVEFNFMVTSLSGVRKYFDDKVNMAGKWNTASYSLNQGICSSFINNECLGVISLKSPLLGFTNIPENSLNIMGYSDIFTNTHLYNLRELDNGLNRCFMPPNKLIDETRYGYNEILLDRFLDNDEKCTLKLQPSYIVFYKMDDNDYKYNSGYQASKKVAKDFGIPIMVVDIPKVKQREKEIILEKEKELFSSIEPKPELLEEIMTRYMNNYTGSLTIVGESNEYNWDYDEDFSVEGIKRFINLFEEFIDTIEDPKIKNKWLDDLEKIYIDEKQKFTHAISLDSWNFSVKHFFLEETKIDALVKYCRAYEEKSVVPVVSNRRNEEWEIDANNYPDVVLETGERAVFLTEKTFSPKLKTIIDLVEYLDFDMGTSFKVEDHEYYGVKGKSVVSDITYVDEILLMENLACYYFFEDSNLDLIDDLDNNNLKVKKEVKINENYDWNTALFNHVYEKDDLNLFHYVSDLAEELITKIEALDDKKFLDIFNPIIDNQSKKTGESIEVICTRLLDKKANFRSNFEKLNKQVDLFSVGLDPFEYNNDKKDK